MIAFPRPSAARLDRWLTEKPDSFERYLTAHPEVADAYEASTALGDAAKRVLVSALEVPLDFAARMRSRVNGLDDTSAAAVTLDLLGLGVASALELIEPPPRAAGEP